MTCLFHVSDIHFDAEDREALDWFAATVHAEQPDAVVVTGDLTMRARHREFEAAAAWLEALKRPVTVEVGNHDLPYFNIWARLFTPYRRYRLLEKMIERPLELPGIAIVPLRTTARFQWRLNWSKGYVAKDALKEAVSVARQAPDDAVVLVTCHHPLVEPHTRMTSRTRGGANALTALVDVGADAVLSGHVHDPFDHAEQVDGREIRLIGAGTLSERVRETRPSFNQLRVEGDTIETVVRTMD